MLYGFPGSPLIAPQIVHDKAQPRTKFTITGKNRGASEVYTYVHEHCEPILKAVLNDPKSF